MGIWSDETPVSHSIHDVEQWVLLLTRDLHTLSNKLLPILVFTDLGARRSQDPKIQEYFEKIHRSAAQAREIVTKLRTLCEEQHPLPDGRENLQENTRLISRGKEGESQ
ncbi:MAG: hypothetical protein D6704_07075 [Nitrospirae bacterium]|nr:MAG: hypothetical protein D6704_07075 [Nitrospirota bacterium]